MSTFQKFREHLTLAENLLASADRDEVNEALVLLATNLAHYQLHYGALNLTEEESNTNDGYPNEKQLAVLIEGMSIIANVLGTVASKATQVKH